MKNSAYLTMLTLMPDHLIQVSLAVHADGLINQDSTLIVTTFKTKFNENSVSTLLPTSYYYFFHLESQFFIPAIPVILLLYTLSCHFFYYGILLCITSLYSFFTSAISNAYNTSFITKIFRLSNFFKFYISFAIGHTCWYSKIRRISEVKVIDLYIKH
jgi:hypothetical protein